MKMSYLSKGYYTICLSPVLSFILYLIISSFFVETEFYQAVFIGLNASIISIQACGIVLCLVGWRKHDTIETLVGNKKKGSLSFDIPLSIPLTVLLIIWGSGIVYLEYFWMYYDMPHGIPLTLGHYVEHATWAVKGIIGIVSGLIFSGKSYLRKGSKRNRPNDGQSELSPPKQTQYQRLHA